MGARMCPGNYCCNMISKLQILAEASCWPPLSSHKGGLIDQGTPVYVRTLLGVGSARLWEDAGLWICCWFAFPTPTQHQSAWPAVTLQMGNEFFMPCWTHGIPTSSEMGNTKTFSAELNESFEQPVSQGSVTAVVTSMWGGKKCH